MAESLINSRHEVALFVFGTAKNPGMIGLAQEYVVGGVCDLNAIKEFALRVKPDFALIGPEAPIAAGVSDVLLENEIHSASPLRIAGRVESSKSFTRDLLFKYKIHGNPKFKVFFDENGLEDFFDELGNDFVVKADGLKGGKGVKVSGDHLANKEEGIEYSKECLEEGGRVVVEEKLIGQEFSLMSFCDGRHVVDMPPVQDHKRAYDDDKGPNTGGMGSYSCENHLLPFLKNSNIEEASDITKKVAKALFEETGVYFKGVIYGGFIATAKGVSLIEYNARFGDSEAMNVLPIMKTDFVDICEAIIQGGLRDLKIEFANKATVCKYVVPDGYPDKPVKGERIVMGAVPDGVKVYYASVDSREDGLYLSGSRAVAFVGIADNLGNAEKLAQTGVESVEGPVFYRKDIGTSQLVAKRVEMMEKLCYKNLRH